MKHTVRHYQIDLALHELRSGQGRALLLLHGLAERSPSTLPDEFVAWPGPIHALDFTGHGASTIPPGGGYTAEILMGDVDIAVGHLGGATLVGRGLGAYIALLVAGARPRATRGAILLDGPGLAGGPDRPGTPLVPVADPDASAPPDPFAVAELATDVRPGDYASSFARQAARLSGLDPAIRVCATERPDWLAAVVTEPGVADCTLPDALAAFSKEF